MSESGQGLTEAEKRILVLTTQLYEAWLALPNAGDNRIPCDAIHVLQDLIAARVGRRANPEVWGQQ